MTEQTPQVEPSRTIRVFVSSPGDVAEERLIAKRVLDRLAAELAPRIDLQAFFWENEPMLVHGAFQDSIPRPSEFDIVVSILWKRLGTPLPDSLKRADGTTYNSGTEFEVEEALAGRRHREHSGIDPSWPDILVYRKTAEPVIRARDRRAAQQEFVQLGRLDEFVERFFQGSGGVLVKAFNPFDNAGEFEARCEEHLRKLIERRLERLGLAVSSPAEPARPTWQGCPFRGLKVFEFEHREIFFGRTREVSEVLEALRGQAAAGCPFLLVVGESGCGKSSLMRAGLLPMLVQPGVIEGVGLWRRVLFRQSDRLGATKGDLFDGLAAALVRDGEALPELTNDQKTSADLAGQLRDNPGRASALVEGALTLVAERWKQEHKLDAPPQARLVLVLDQLEELFTADDLEAAHRQAFFAAVADLARGGQTFVLATLRSDFFHRAAEIPALSELKSTSGQYHLQPPDAAGIAQLIRRPAFAAGLRYEEDFRTGTRLDDRLLDEAAGNRDSLPLLEFLLEELYERRTGQVLTLAAHDELGGISGVVARRAEEVFNDPHLPDSARAALPLVLRHLVTLSADDGAAPARKPAPLAAFDGPNGADGQTSGLAGPLAGREPLARAPQAERLTPSAPTPARQLVDALVSARLLTAKQTDDGTSVVEITHEKLLTSWNRVGKWLEVDQDLLRIHQRVAAAAKNWEESKRSSALLLQPGKPLLEGRQLLQAEFPVLPIERELIKQSEIAALRRARIRRAAVTSLVLLTLLAVTGAWWARVERNKAEESRNKAEQSEARAVQSRKESEQSAKLAEQSAKLAEESRNNAEQSEKRAVQSRTAAEQNAKLAEEQRDLAIQSLNTLVFDVQDKLEGHPGLQDLKRQLLRAALEGLQQISKSFQSSSGRSDRSAAAAQMKIGDIMLELGATKDAAELYHAAIAIFERLAQADPKNARAQRDLSFSYTSLGDLRVRQGDLAAARKFYEQSLEIDKRLGQADPQNAEAQRDLSISYDRLGDVSVQQGDLAAARTFYEQGLEIRQRLAQADPQNAQAQRDLSISYNHLGDVSVQQGDLAAARKFYEQDLEIARRLAQTDPQNTQAKRDLSVSYNKLGDVSVQQGDLAAARTFYEQGLEIRQRLAQADPQNTQAKRDLSVSYNKLGDVSVQQGDLASARKFYEQGLEIAERLAKADPNNAEAQRDLMFSHYKLGSVRESEFKLAEAIAEYRQGIAVLEKLVAAGTLAESSQREIKILEQRIAGCQNAIVATGDWDALLRLPAEQLPLLLYQRSMLLAKQGRIADAEQAAAKLRTLEPKKAGNLYLAASGYALCVQALGMAPAPDEKKAGRQKDVELALACLKEAIAAGYNNFDELRKDSDFLALRELAEFQALFPAEKKPPPTKTPPDEEAGGSER